MAPALRAPSRTGASPIVIVGAVVFGLGVIATIFVPIYQAGVGNPIGSVAPPAQATVSIFNDTPARISVSVGDTTKLLWPGERLATPAVDSPLTWVGTYHGRVVFERTFGAGSPPVTSVIGADMSLPYEEPPPPAKRGSHYGPIDSGDAAGPQPYWQQAIARAIASGDISQQIEIVRVMLVVFGDQDRAIQRHAARLVASLAGPDRERVRSLFVQSAPSLSHVRGSTELARKLRDMPDVDWMTFALALDGFKPETAVVLARYLAQTDSAIGPIGRLPTPIAHEVLHWLYYTAAPAPMSDTPERRAAVMDALSAIPEARVAAMVDTPSRIRPYLDIARTTRFTFANVDWACIPLGARLAMLSGRELREVVSRGGATVVTHLPASAGTPLGLRSGEGRAVDILLDGEPAGLRWLSDERRFTVLYEADMGEVANVPVRILTLRKIVVRNTERGATIRGFTDEDEQLFIARHPARILAVSNPHAHGSERIRRINMVDQDGVEIQLRVAQGTLGEGDMALHVGLALEPTGRSWRGLAAAAYSYNHPSTHEASRWIAITTKDRPDEVRVETLASTDADPRDPPDEPAGPAAGKPIRFALAPRAPGATTPGFLWTGPSRRLVVVGPRAIRHWSPFSGHGRSTPLVGSLPPASDPEAQTDATGLPYMRPALRALDFRGQLVVVLDVQGTVPGEHARFARLYDPISLFR